MQTELAIKRTHMAVGQPIAPLHIEQNRVAPRGRYDSHCWLEPDKAIFDLAALGEGPVLVFT